MGRFEQGELELKKAQELDPLSLLINTSIGRQLYFARQYDAAVQQFQKTLEMDPKFVPAQHALEAAYAQSGMYKEAVAERQQVLTLSGNPDLAAAIGEDFRTSGYPGVLRSWLEGLQGGLQERLCFLIQHVGNLRQARTETRSPRGPGTGIQRTRQQSNAYES